MLLLFIYRGHFNAAGHRAGGAVKANHLYRYCFLTAVLLLAILWTGCAYLNTFYNARTAYKTARREHKKLLRLKPDSAETLPPRISDLYDRAIAKSLKVLDVYPKSKDWHDDAVYLMARASFYKNELSSAIRRFRRLQREYPESPFIPESYRYLGKAYLANDNLEKAEETFEFILDKYPQLNENEEITLLLAQVAIEREGKSQAIGLLEKTLESVKTPEKRMEILLQIAQLYIDLAQYEKAISVLKKAPRKKNFPERLYTIDFAMLICYGKSGQHEKALKLSAVMMKDRKYIAHYPDIRYQKALVLKSAGRIKEAVGVFEQITKATIAPAIQGLAWYELALIHQHEYGDLKKAKECYDKALSLTTDKEIKQIAQERSRAIGELDSYRMLLNEQIAEKDTADTADTAAAALVDTTDPRALTRYKMGEIFWLHLEEPDSALNHFAVIAADSNAGDTLQTQALYARAFISLHMKEDSTLADSLFELIIERCPATLFAKRSQEQLGIPVTVKTREDSAHIAMIKAENLYYDDGDALAASRAYLRVANSYPDLDAGAQSIYAAAWLCDEVLHKNVTARKLYQMLCDSFPKSDLCRNQAKPRLQLVEDTLAAIKLRKEKEKSKPKKQKRLSGKRRRAEKETPKGEQEHAGEDAALLGEAEAEDTSAIPPASDTAAVQPGRKQGSAPADSPEPQAREEPPADAADSSQAAPAEPADTDNKSTEKDDVGIKELPTQKEPNYTNSSDSGSTRSTDNEDEGIIEE
jgi:tetratricopeptide (TPR) repeat protein